MQGAGADVAPEAVQALGGGAGARDLEDAVRDPRGDVGGAGLDRGHPYREVATGPLGDRIGECLDRPERRTRP
ncbi:hypothetical protein GCM10009564_34000 [Streptomyces thermogriseus]|uniref:Uncharacterized protein n=1 Tax=Streptomyces thermogriseus TaxID=75292 RepID=A0ABN1T1X8_9ACTN